MSTVAHPLDLEARGVLERDAVAAWLAELAASLSQSHGMDVEFDGVTYPVATSGNIELHVGLRITDDVDDAIEPTTRLDIALSWSRDA